MSAETLKAWAEEIGSEIADLSAQLAGAEEIVTGASAKAERARSAHAELAASIAAACASGGVPGIIRDRLGEFYDDARAAEGELCRARNAVAAIQSSIETRRGALADIARAVDPPPVEPVSSTAEKRKPAAVPEPVDPAEVWEGRAAAE